MRIQKLNPAVRWDDYEENPLKRKESYAKKGGRTPPLLNRIRIQKLIPPRPLGKIERQVIGVIGIFICAFGDVVDRDAMRIPIRIDVAFM